MKRDSRTPGKSPRTPRAFGLATAMTAVLLALAVTGRAAPAKEYRIMVPVAEGLSMGSLSTLLNNVSGAIEKKIGLKIKVLEFKHTVLDDPVAGMLDAMNRDEIDVAMVYSSDYLRYLMSKKSNALPLVTLMMYGKPYRNLCVMTRKADNITSVDQLRGKVWGGTCTRYARYILYSNGFGADKPMASFFSKMLYVNDASPANMFDALLAKKIDVFTMPDYLYNMAANGNAEYKKGVAMGNCVEYEHNWLFVYRKGAFSPEEVELFMKSFDSMHKDPDFAQFKFLLSAVKGKFTRVDLNNLKTTKKIARLALDGWFKEEKEFLKKYYKK